MPRQGSVTVDNNLVNGLVTEATALNFPEGAVTETYNCVFDTDGSVYRREGFGFEIPNGVKPVNREGAAVVTYQWRNVGGDGNVNLVCVQIGSVVYFYEVDDLGVISTHAVSDTVSLVGVSGAPVVAPVEAQFSDGNGYLFITHPYCNPIKVSYDPPSKNVISESIDIKIRDFEGDIEDTYDVDERPTSDWSSLNIHHKYNLLNQGWTQTNINSWDTAQTTMPSNADVMWRFRDSSDDFDASNASIARVVAGNTPAPKGHFIGSLANFDRATLSGITGAPSSTTGFQRPSTSAFFAGRLFYSGINFVGYNSDIYFTQIIERDDQYQNCHQVNDPTAEDLFDILPSDGGVISIPDAGTIIKLVTVPGGMCVFAANGVWYITGSTGIGFTATDYTVQKVTDITALTASSFVSVAGYPCWWNMEGIYIMVAQGNFPTVKSLTDTKIKKFYEEIPLSSKRFAKGYFHVIDGHIRWVYRSTVTGKISEQYEYDRVLNFNIHTNAFYPWTVSESGVKINSIVATSISTKYTNVLNVVDSSGDNVVDSNLNDVVVYSVSGTVSPQYDKYLVSYFDGTDYQMTFANRNNFDYMDWAEYESPGKSYDSYFITGVKLQGNAIRNFQNNWVRVFSRLDDPVQYYFQGIWDFANTGSGTGKWSVKQFCKHDNLNYSTDSRRLKVRGNGLAIQFKVSSVPGKPFDIIGWSTTQLVNAVP